MSTAQFLLSLGRNSAEAGVLVLVILLAQRLFRRQLAPRWRCALWLLLVARLLLPVSAGSIVSIFNLTPRFNQSGLVPTAPFVTHAATAVAKTASLAGRQSRVRAEFGSELDSTSTVGPAADGTADRWTPRKISWPTIISGVWLTGVAILLIHLVVSSIRLARQIARAPVVKAPRTLAILKECQERLGVQRSPVIVESGVISAPALFGLVRPRLLMPKYLAADFSPQELRFIFLHELAHLKRSDLVLNWLVSILQTLHWFNPFVWLGFARWRLDRELACDAVALEALGGDQKREYGETILRLLQRIAPLPATPGLVGILEDKRQLRQRILQIAQFRPASRWSILALALFSVIAAGCLTDAQRPKSAAGPSLTLQLRMVKPFGVNGQTVPYFDSFIGQRTIDGIPFDIQGIVTLYGEAAARGNAIHQVSLMGIPVGRSFDELHLIHSAKYSADPDGTPIATIRLNYADGATYQFDIVYGAQVRDWLRTPFEGKETLTDRASKVIWRAPGPPDAKDSSWRFFKSVFRNPYPQKVVQSIDVWSTRNQSCYALAAATVADADPMRIMTPPLALHDSSWRLDGRMVVRVLDASTGRPISDARICVTPLRNGLWHESYFAGHTGEATVRYAVGHTDYLELSACMGGYPEATMVMKGALPAQYIFQLSPGKRVGGVVLDDENQPVAGAIVLVNTDRSVSGLEGSAVNVGSPFSMTDTAGRWSASGVPAQNTGLHVQVAAPGHAQAVFSTLGRFGDPVEIADLIAGTAMLRLTDEYVVEGFVHDQAGRPITGATIRAYSPGASNTPRAKTGSKGRFRLRHLQLGDYEVAIEANGYGAEFRSVTISTANSPIDVVLNPAGNSAAEKDLQEAAVDFSDPGNPKGEPFAVEMAIMIQNQNELHLDDYQRMVVQKAYQNLSRKIIEIETPLAVVDQSEAHTTVVTIPVYQGEPVQKEFESFIDQRLGAGFGAKVRGIYQQRILAQNHGLRGIVQTITFEKRDNDYSVVQRGGEYNLTFHGVTFNYVDGVIRPYFIYPPLGRVYWRAFEHYKYLYPFLPE